MTLGASGVSQAMCGHEKWHNGNPQLPRGPQLLQLVSPQGAGFFFISPQSQGLSKLAVPDEGYMISGMEKADSVQGEPFPSLINVTKPMPSTRNH